MTNFIKQHESELEARNANDSKELKEAKMCQAIYEGLEVKEGMTYRTLSDMPYISPHAAYADAFAMFDVETLDEAFNLMEGYDTLNTYECRDGCMSIRPITHLKDKRNDFTKTGKLIAPYHAYVDGCLGHTEEIRFMFYVEIAGYTVQIRLMLHDRSIRRDYQKRDVKGGYSITDTRVFYDDRYFDTSYKMGRGSEEHPNSFTLIAQLSGLDKDIAEQAAHYGMTVKKHGAHSTRAAELCELVSEDDE